jgi:hypothetical protein
MIKKHLFTLAMIGAVAFTQVVPMAAFTPVMVQAKVDQQTQQEISTVAGTPVNVDEASNGMTKVKDNKSASPEVLTGAGLYINGGKVKTGSDVTDNTKEVYYQIPDAVKLDTSETGTKLVAVITKNTCPSIKVSRGKIVYDAKYKTDLASVSGSIKNNIVKVKAGKLTTNESGPGDVILWVAKINKSQKVFVHSGTNVEAEKVVAVQNITVKVAPKNIDICNHEVANTQAAKGTGYNWITKKEAVPVSGDITVYLKPSQAKDKKDTIDGLSFEPSAVEKDGKGKVSVNAGEYDPNKGYPFTITGKELTSNNKVASVKVTFTCLQNGKKVALTASVGNPVTGISVANTSTDDNVVVKNIQPIADKSDYNIDATVDKAKDIATKPVKIAYDLEETTRVSGTATTDTPKVYHLASAGYDPTSSTNANFIAKGKPATTDIDKNPAVKATLKKSDGKYQLIVTAPKGTTTTKQATFLIVYNNKYDMDAKTYGFSKISYTLNVQ